MNVHGMNIKHADITMVADCEHVVPGAIAIDVGGDKLQVVKFQTSLAQIESIDPSLPVQYHIRTPVGFMEYKDIGTAAAFMEVVAAPPRQSVTPIAALKDIVAIPTKERIPTGLAIDQLGSRGSDDPVCGTIAVDLLVRAVVGLADGSLTRSGRIARHRLSLGLGWGGWGV
ncbi:hypothetical protein MES5069_50001 [Mesorhizobium escarrei]|uniref:Uncharacterized protein n=1 Tax=Mesorhizobium escarrei TaxID=666018 RepID=A0ABM9E9E8_9HYPH|nr:hypothetical protein MES5069_50001 [Mesorhizobium escarrei]